ncbi:ParB/RepB/Spo0J family partition protein [Streptomyces sp. CB01249]|uniref:ParB/RepB/Spo0J family partition protein n=1 Tax=Streptomyces sp. CB01249 TaxID=1703929 RepID=UPI000AEC72DE|nr:ParB/RepB/Spo0J family partition protein [Streptomyces sp. CB01249]
MNGIAARMRDQPPYFTQSVYVKDLVVADSPRINGVDEAHARRLADVFPSLPPILVHSPSMRVIDGIHRVRAAIILGLDTVDTQFFVGSEAEAFIQAVARNTADGLLLTLADRSAAVRRILDSFPAMSDLSVAVYTGLDAGVVAEVRWRAAVGAAEPDHAGGAARLPEPVTAACAQAATPGRSNPGEQREPGERTAGALSGGAPQSAGECARGHEEEHAPRAQPSLVPPRVPTARDPQLCGGRPVMARTARDRLRILSNNPSLRNSQAGREFLRWLHGHFLTDKAWKERVDAIPPHCTETVAEIALKCADAWRRFAEELSDRERMQSVPAGRSRA